MSQEARFAKNFRKNFASTKEMCIYLAQRCVHSRQPALLPKSIRPGASTFKKEWVALHQELDFLESDSPGQAFTAEERLNLLKGRSDQEIITYLQQQQQRKQLRRSKGSQCAEESKGSEKEDATDPEDTAQDDSEGISLSQEGSQMQGVNPANADLSFQSPQRFYGSFAGRSAQKDTAQSSEHLGGETLPREDFYEETLAGNMRALAAMKNLCKQQEEICEMEKELCKAKKRRLTRLSDLQDLFKEC